MRLLLFGLMCITANCFAQKAENNWYFGRYAAINFDSGVGQPKYDNPQYIYGKTISISHPVTGKLLFYSNGTNVWNGNHNLLQNGNIPSASPTGDLVATPFPNNPLKYYLFFIGNIADLQYVVIDMNANNGEGAVVSAAQTLSSNNTKQIAAVSHQYTSGFWIITHELNNNVFKAHYVDETGLNSAPIKTAIGANINTYGDMVFSNQGHKLAVTHYAASENTFAEIFDFDRVCGTFSNKRELYKEPIWDYAYGIAFSPDDSKLYISYSYELSQIVQYYGNNYENSYFIATAQSNFNIMRLGPDGRIYIATHDNGVPGPRIDAILKPNEISGSSTYIKTYLTLDEGRDVARSAQFELPAFVRGKIHQSPIADSVFTIANTCEGTVTQFQFNTSNPFDSLQWIFHDTTLVSSKLSDPKHLFSKAGTFKISLHIYRCGNDFELIDSISIKPKPIINFPTDTNLCNGSLLRLESPLSEKYNWSTGEKTQSITISEPGKYWLAATNGNCTNSDTISVKNYPEIITQLGDVFYLCEDDQELVKLNAGEGFAAYKWTPTNDTTQWIIVKNIGDYFVKVTDNFGCIGNDKTKVKRRCGVLLHVPTVFSPNNDGINDYFLPKGLDIESYQLEIYNRWGQLIFTSNKLEHGWDGTIGNTTAEAGVYVYRIKYSGYKNKKMQEFVVKGNVTLLR